MYASVVETQEWNCFASSSSWSYLQVQLVPGNLVSSENGVLRLLWKLSSGTFLLCFDFFVSFFSLLYAVQGTIGLALSLRVEVSYGSQCLALKGGTFAWEEGSSAHVKQRFFFLNLHASLQLNSQRLTLFKD